MDTFNLLVIPTAQKLHHLTVANLAFKYIQLEQEYVMINEKWIGESPDYLLVEALFHLAKQARLERVHPVYANMLISDWVYSPSHTQTLCWFNQLKNALRKLNE